MGNTKSTSREAYHGLAHMGSQEERIARLILYYTLRGMDITIGEIKAILRMEKSTVAARVNGLRFIKPGDPDNTANWRRFLIDGAEYMVYCNGKRKCTQSGVTCLTWQIHQAEANPQLKLNLN